MSSAASVKATPQRVLWRVFDANLLINKRHGEGRETEISPGFLHLIERTYREHKCLFLEWYATKPRSASGEDQASGRARTVSADMTIDLSELKSFKWTEPDKGRVKVTFILNDGSNKPQIDLSSEAYNSLVDQIMVRYTVSRSRTNTHLCLVDDKGKSAVNEKGLTDLQSLTEHGGDFLKKFYKNPSTTLLTGFSRVTNLLNDAVDQLVQNDVDQNSYQELESAFSVLRMQEEHGFEVVSMCQIKLPPVPEVQRGSPLTVEEWSNYIDCEGRINRPDALKEAIFRGGMVSEVRGQVWKYLLGYYKYNLTNEEQKERREVLKESYYRMKTQWQTVTAEQEKRWTLFRERKDIIDKDVFRTDRTHPYYAGDNPNLTVLYEILMTYCMWNWDLGYVQGMSDLLSPVLILMDDEVDAFWCFHGFMELVDENFDMDKMKANLESLSRLMNIIDPALHKYINRKDSGKLYFCFRWLLILFKREFCFSDLLRLWEVVFTGLRCKNFHLLVALAILENERNTLMENKFGLTEILKHINDLAMNIDLEATLKKAEGMYLQLANVPDLPKDIGDILGLPGICQLPLTDAPPKETSPGRNMPTSESARFSKTGEVVDIGHTLLS